MTTCTQRAMDATIGADLHSSIELFVETKERECLLELVRCAADSALEQVGHYPPSHRENAAKIASGRFACRREARRSAILLETR